jgi:hypothetical protein
MHTKLIVAREKDIITATAEGILTFEESRQALADVAAATESSGDYKLLLDTRRARSRLSAADLWHLAAELPALGMAFRHKTAVLCLTQKFDDARFFAVCAQNRGFPVRGFTAFEDAMTWLNGKPATPAQATAFRVPRCTST